MNLYRHVQVNGKPVKRDTSRHSGTAPATVIELKPWPPHGANVWSHCEPGSRFVGRRQGRMQSARKPGDRPDVHTNGAAGASSGDHIPITPFSDASFNVINERACGRHALGNL